MTLFYLSFATDEGFQGATVVCADDAQDAVIEASFRGLNPGGQVMVVEIPPEIESKPDVVMLFNRLAGKEEMMAAGGMRLGDLPEDAQDILQEMADVICEDCNGSGESRRK